MICESRLGIHLCPCLCVFLSYLFIENCIYYRDNLYNTNSDFDWGALRQLKEEMTLSWTPPSFFSLVFSHSGVYVFKLSSNQHKHMVTKLKIT